ncbi:MAG: nitrate reductase subunit beta [Deltaproteobacteria bacterium]|nr:nitrate reductase subunit beta [Deltaproteobacteria bacterium]
MDIRAQVSMVFHLDKCIGCHTCSIACKNVWTDRKGAEYMWWNNVETKPGTGYPTAWEDQERYGGGWTQNGDVVQLRVNGRFRGLANIFHNPKLPVIDDYYEPWTYRYQDLFDAPASDDQPTARAVSLITGEPMNIEAGPNWDDDLGGSPVYAANDPNRAAMTPQEREMMFEVERLTFFYLPRICNHCLNPACVAACPSSALYKRGEDGIVVLNQERCRGWRLCVSACPYKKTYFNWATGKSEKCILCYPRVETGQAPACFHSCVGRIRYLGILLYDADKILPTATMPDAELVEAQRAMILDPHDPEVIREAEKNGIHPSVIESAQKSPVYKFVKEWKLALPLHIEYRTLPMLFYVPPLLPVLAKKADTYDTATEDLWAPIEEARLPIEYMASLFAAGNVGKVRHAMKKELAVRYFRRHVTVGDVPAARVDAMLAEVGSSREEAEAIYRLTSLPLFDERFVIPPSHREEAVEALESPFEFRGATGFGFREKPTRGL